VFLKFFVKDFDLLQDLGHFLELSLLKIRFYFKFLIELFESLH
jgi:hypothetical protein